MAQALGEGPPELRKCPAPQASLDGVGGQSLLAAVGAQVERRRVLLAAITTAGTKDNKAHHDSGADPIEKYRPHRYHNEGTSECRKRRREEIGSVIGGIFHAGGERLEGDAFAGSGVCAPMGCSGRACPCAAGGRPHAHGPGRPHAQRAGRAHAAAGRAPPWAAASRAPHAPRRARP